MWSALSYAELPLVYLLRWDVKLFDPFLFFLNQVVCVLTVEF